MPDYFGAADLTTWTAAQLFEQMQFFADIVGNPGNIVNLDGRQLDGVHQVITEIRRRVDRAQHGPLCALCEGPRVNHHPDHPFVEA